MADLLSGLGVPSIPSINLTGFLSSSWIYILIVGLIGFALIVGVGLFLFFKTYNRKIVIFENLSGAGYQPSLKSRARIIRLGTSGEEVLKILYGGKYVSAYGRKMGKNTYWFAKGQDGYLYNFIMGDLDTKLAMLDIEPVDRDVRMFHVSLDRLHHATYDKQNFLQKYAVHLLLFVFLIVLIFGMWFIIGKVGSATAPLAQANENQVKLAQTNLQITERLDNLVSQLNIREKTNSSGGSGLISAG